MFNQSNIVSDKQSYELLNLINFPLNKKWTLLYQGTRDGFGADVFHSKCDGINNTITLIKTSREFVFGGFATAQWNDTTKNVARYVTDANAFLFTLVNQFVLPSKLKVLRPETAIAINPQLLPAFGYGHDLHIANKAIETNSGSYSRLGYSYELPNSFKYGTVDSESLLAGSSFFQTSEIEVYSIEGIFYRRIYLILSDIIKFNLKSFSSLLEFTVSKWRSMQRDRL